ncbi:MAG: hypothetical protein Fur0037_20880 [Planctomycetota bacterium]
MRTIALIASLSLCGASALAQEQGSRQEPRQEQTAPSPKADPGPWIQKLGDPSYKTRIAAEKALIGIGKAALPALREAAERDEAPEIQWRARRLIRRIEQGDSGEMRERGGLKPRTGARDRAWDPFGGFDLRGRFDELFRQLERDFGMDIPRHRFFADDFFQDLRGQMDQAREEWEKALKAGPGSKSRSQSMSMQMGPDGVRVEVKTKNENGEEEVKTYEAEDLESFRKKYPGVLEGNGLGGGIRLWADRRGFLDAAPRLMPGLRLAPDDATEPYEFDDLDVDSTVPPPDQRLGVFVRPEIPAPIRDYLGLREGEGLMVQEVQDGTLASRLGLQVDDIVMRIGDRQIGSVEDVREALSAIEAGKTVEVEVLRKGKTMVAKAEKPSAGKTEDKEKEGGKEGDDGKKDPPKRLRLRKRR